MNKDVIYIDTEDDITAIIGKIKDGKEKIVALVPPKRTGVLQSAVNLRLLARMAETSNKKLVIVTTNKALIALAAAAMIPIAKSLQSKPELAEVEEAESDESDDVIDGAQLPVGELAKTADIRQEDSVADAIETIDIEELETPRADKEKEDKPRANSNIPKIPDFKNFRKKLFIVIGASVFLIIFLVWAIKFAPAAKVIVTTTTTSAPVSATVKLGGSGEATSVSKNVIQTVTKQLKKDLSVEFTATGTKDNGTRASGKVELYISSMPSSKSIIDAGDQVQFGDKNYEIMEPVTIVRQAGGDGSAEVDVTAVENGESYNVLPGNACSVVGSPSITCGSTLGIGGGTTNMVTIVTAADVQKASQVLVDMSSAAVQTQLTKQFINEEKVIADSFTIDRAAGVSVPAIGEVATGKAKLTSATTYSLTAIAKSELQTFLRDSVTKQITNSSIQRIYSDGSDSAVLSGYTKSDQLSTVNISATGKIGPSIDEAYVLKVVKGKHFGDIQSTLGQVSGVEDVDVKFSYFWVATVPNDKSKITIEFVSADAGSK